MSDEQHCSEDDVIQKYIDYLLIEKKQKIVKDNFEVTYVNEGTTLFYIRKTFIFYTKIF